jgi:folate-binding protein YgfZ
MISNEVEGLREREGNYGTLLTATGKILADFYYYRFSDFLLIDVAGDLGPQLVTELQKYIIMDDVELQDISGESGHYSIQGPRALDLLESILGSGAPASQNAVSPATWGGESLWWIRKNELVEPGFEIIFPNSIRREFRDAFLEEGVDYGLSQFGLEAYELLRLERGIPLYGVDFTRENNPVEARLTEAYSLTKGCFVGHEVVSKATLVGSVPKALVRLKILGEEVPPARSRVVELGGKEIGRITSAAFSPVLGHAIALAFVKKGFWTPGDIHHVEIPSEGMLRVEVVKDFRLPGVTV